MHTVEIAILNGAQASPKERELLALINEILHEAEYDPSESVSLAAGVATTWGWLLQDVSKGSPPHHTTSVCSARDLLTVFGCVKVWIWGITPRMGSALGLLAKGYERVKMANDRSSIDGGLRV